MSLKVFFTLYSYISNNVAYSALYFIIIGQCFVVLYYLEYIFEFILITG